MNQFVIHNGRQVQIFELMELLPVGKIDFDVADFNIAEEIIKDLRFESIVQDILIRTNEMEFFPFLVWVVSRAREEQKNIG